MQRFGDRVAGTLVIRQTPLAAPREEFWARQKYNSFMDHPSIAMKLRRAATPELASLIQDALRRRNELAPYARREIYRELANYLQSEISPFPDELVEILSDEQYLINAAGVLFRDQRLSLRNCLSSTSGVTSRNCFFIVSCIGQLSEALSCAYSLQRSEHRQGVRAFGRIS